MQALPMASFYVRHYFALCFLAAFLSESIVLPTFSTLVGSPIIV